MLKQFTTEVHHSIIVLDLLMVQCVQFSDHKKIKELSTIGIKELMH